MVSRARLVVVLLLALVATACSEGPGAGGPLEGTSWIVRSIAVDGALTIVEEQFYADADFSAQRVSGRSGCNTYDARYRAGGRTLFVSEPAATLMACDEATLDLRAGLPGEPGGEPLLHGLADHADHLQRRSRDAPRVRRLAAQPVARAVGRRLVRDRPEHREPAPRGHRARRRLRADQRRTARPAATPSTARTARTATSSAIGRLATTRMACEQDVMDQETAFLDALQGVAFLDRTSNTTLNLTDRNGSLVIALKRPETEEAASPAPSGAAVRVTDGHPVPDAEPDPQPVALAHAEPDRARRRPRRARRRPRARPPRPRPPRPALRPSRPSTRTPAATSSSVTRRMRRWPIRRRGSP